MKKVLFAAALTLVATGAYAKPMEMVVYGQTTPSADSPVVKKCEADARKNHAGNSMEIDVTTFFADACVLSNGQNDD